MPEIGLKSLVLFDDLRSSTLAIPEDEFSLETVIAHLAGSEARWQQGSESIAGALCRRYRVENGTRLPSRRRSRIPQKQQRRNMTSTLETPRTELWPCIIVVGKGSQEIHRWNFNDIERGFEFFLAEIAEGNFEAAAEFFFQGRIENPDGHWVATNQRYDIRADRAAA
jgi:hypothetical protein